MQGQTLLRCADRTLYGRDVGQPSLIRNCSKGPCAMQAAQSELAARRVQAKVVKYERSVSTSIHA
jgi:hypothetical protein